jgi:hypothetical protein
MLSVQLECQTGFVMQDVLIWINITDHSRLKIACQFHHSRYQLGF